MSGKEVIRVLVMPSVDAIKSNPRLQRGIDVRMATIDQIQAMRALLQDVAAVPARGPDGAELPVQLDVDWWSSGGLKAIDARLIVLSKALTDAGVLAGRDLARHIETFDLPDLRRQLDDTIARARLAAVMAQFRHNLAGRTANALERLGFEVEVHAYEAGDARRRMLLGVRGPQDSKLTIVLANGPEPGEVLVELHSFDADQRPDHILRRRLGALCQAIKDAGVNVQVVTAGQADADEHLRHLETLTEPSA